MLMLHVRLRFLLCVRFCEIACTANLAPTHNIELYIYIAKRIYGDPARINIKVYSLVHKAYIIVIISTVNNDLCR